MIVQGLLGDLGGLILLGRTSAHTYVTVDPANPLVFQLWEAGPTPQLLDELTFAPDAGYAVSPGAVPRPPMFDGHPPEVNRHWLYPIPGPDAGDVVVALLGLVTTGSPINPATAIIALRGSTTLSMAAAYQVGVSYLQAHIAADSSQVVTVNYQTITFYDLPAMTLAATCDTPDVFDVYSPTDWLPGAVDNPYTGYVLSVPKRNRFLWRNTSPSTIYVHLKVTDVTYDGESGLVRSYTATYDMRPLVFRPTILSTAGSFMGTQTAQPPQNVVPTSGQMTWNSENIGPDLASPGYYSGIIVSTPVWNHGFTAEGLDLSGLGDSATELVAVTAVSASGTVYDWGWNRSILPGDIDALVDNTVAGGNHIELRDETGALLDAVPYEAEADHLHKWFSIDGQVGYLRYPGQGMA